MHRVAAARDTFQRLVQQHPADASYQIGMAYACAMLFEATRTDPAPLGFVLERTGRRAEALAALKRALALDPTTGVNQVRLALGSWGETRLQAARRALAQCAVAAGALTGGQRVRGA